MEEKKVYPVRWKSMMITMLVLAFVLSSVSLRAQENSLQLAIDGMDPVSYFQNDSPRAGIPGIQIVYEGAIWYFSDEENLLDFLDSPEAFIPKFSGYSAWAVSVESLVPGNPRIWYVQNGSLLFFRSEGTKRRWLTDPDTNYRKAGESWPRLEHEMRNRLWKRFP